MRVLILIEGGPDGQVEITVAADGNWRADRSKALPAQRLAQALMDFIETHSDRRFHCDLCLQPHARRRR